MVDAASDTGRSRAVRWLAARALLARRHTELVPWSLAIHTVDGSQVTAPAAAALITQNWQGPG